jgi:hypothetical protein
MQALYALKQHWANLQAGAKHNPRLAIALVPLVILVVVLQARIDPLRRQKAIEPPTAKNIGGTINVKGNTTALPFEYMLGAVSGFRQVIAGLLWVRTDSFFHTGNYDAVLPMLRMITWLDPNWTDVYATGGWHITYNFTDTDQRSDRRYLPPGLAFLSEGIANNPSTYELYKEKGWTNYDKVKDYEEAIIAYEGGWNADLKHDKEGNLLDKNDNIISGKDGTVLPGKENDVVHMADVNQVLHALGHSYERAGQVDKAIDTWKLSSNEHQSKMADKSKDKPADSDFRNSTGKKNANENLSMLLVRKQNRLKDTKVPVDPLFTFKVTRLRPKVLLFEGSWNCIGSRSYDAGEFDSDRNVQKIGNGVVLEGPVDGTRVEVRLQDQGYKMPRPESFSFDVDPTLTLMQDAVACRNGRRVEAGGAYIEMGPEQVSLGGDQNAEISAIYGFPNKEAKEKVQGVPVKSALSGALPVSPFGKRQLVTYAYGKTYGGKNFIELSEVESLFNKLKSDTAKLDAMTKANICIARNGLSVSNTFKREVDMSKDENIYSLKKDKYDLFLTLNPRLFPANVQDRLGWNGEGIKSDAKYVENLPAQTITVPAFTEKGKPITYTTAPLRRIRASLTLTKEQIMGKGEEVLIDSSKM